MRDGMAAVLGRGASRERISEMAANLTSALGVRDDCQHRDEMDEAVISQGGVVQGSSPGQERDGFTCGCAEGT